jgi:hypothetical protein
MDLTEYNLQQLQNFQLRLEEWMNDPLYKLMQELQKETIFQASRAIVASVPSSIADFTVNEQAKGAVQEAERQLGYFQSLAEDIAEVIEHKKQTSGE